MKIPKERTNCASQISSSKEGGNWWRDESIVPVEVDDGTSVSRPCFEAIASEGWPEEEEGGGGEIERATLRAGEAGVGVVYAHVSSPRNGSMLEIARPAGEYEVSRLRFRQGLCSSSPLAVSCFTNRRGKRNSTYSLHNLFSYSRASLRRLPIDPPVFLVDLVLPLPPYNFHPTLSSQF